MLKQQLDGYAFIDSEGTGLSAVAGYPELTVPLAKNSEGQPYGLTLHKLPIKSKRYLSKLTALNKVQKDG